MARNIGWNTADVNGGSSRLPFGPAISAHAVENDDEQARKPLPVASVIEAPASILKHGGRYKEDRSREVDGVRYDVDGHVFEPTETFSGMRKGFVFRNGESPSVFVYILYLWVLISLYNIMYCYINRINNPCFVSGSEGVGYYEERMQKLATIQRKILLPRISPVQARPWLTSACRI